MNFKTLHNRFIRKCFIFRQRVKEISLLRSKMTPWQIHYLIESLLSDIWQSWCMFCRQLILLSCQGTIARNGDVVAKRLGDTSELRLTYEAKQYAAQQPLKPNGQNAFHKRYEPTWGDLNLLIRMISGLNPNNSANLLVSVGSFSKIKELQFLRNACAHKNSETISGVKLMFLVYGTHNVNYLSEYAFCSSAGARLVEIWLFEMETIAFLATEKS
jgi:hypothetical protein